jgi:hypothetical protein
LEEVSVLEVDAKKMARYTAELERYLSDLESQLRASEANLQIKGNCAVSSFCFCHVSTHWPSLSVYCREQLRNIVECCPVLVSCWRSVFMQYVALIVAFCHIAGTIWLLIIGLLPKALTGILLILRET